MAGNFLSQELALLTGVVEAMVVDVQCIMQALGDLSARFHTRLITTSPKADAKRAALKLPAYDPSRFGASGDHGLEPIIALPFEERLAALYGNGHN